MIFNITTTEEKIQEKFHKEIINFRFVELIDGRTSCRLWIYVMI